jgi:hypothetical protein
MSETARNKEFLKRLNHRLSVLEERLLRVDAEASFRGDILKERNALHWAINTLAAERQRADDAEALIREMDYCFRIERDGMAESLCSEYVAKRLAAVDERQK